VLRLSAAGLIDKLEVDTNHFKGNCPESCVVEAASCPEAVGHSLASELHLLTGPASASKWKPVIRRTKLTPHSRHFFDTLQAGSKEPQAFTHVRIKIYPDGGVSRLRVFGRPATATAGK